MTQPSQKPAYGPGDSVTISRGKLRGQTGRVLDVDTVREQYALSTADGLTVVSFQAVKAPVEKTLTASQFREILDKHEDNPARIAAIEDYFNETPAAD